MVKIIVIVMLIVVLYYFGVIYCYETFTLEI
jgi:hypothetical protein